MRVMIVRDGSVADAARMIDRISASLCLQEMRSCRRAQCELSARDRRHDSYADNTRRPLMMGWSRTI